MPKDTGTDVKNQLVSKSIWQQKYVVNYLVLTCLTIFVQTVNGMCSNTEMVDLHENFVLFWSILCLLLFRELKWLFHTHPSFSPDHFLSIIIYEKILDYNIKYYVESYSTNNTIHHIIYIKKHKFSEDNNTLLDTISSSEQLGEISQFTLESYWPWYRSALSPSH